MWDLLNKADFKPEVTLLNREVSSPPAAPRRTHTYLMVGMCVLG